MRPKALIFDMGDIFMDVTPWRKNLTGILQAFKVDIDYQTLCQKWENDLIPVYRGHKEYWVAFQHLLQSFGLKKSTREHIEKLAKNKAQNLGKRYLFDGVPQTLKYLHENKIRLAVLSDTEKDSKSVSKSLQKHEIAKYFQAVITSNDIGYVKPEPQSYQRVLEELSVTAKEAAFVGHDEDELSGAQQQEIFVIAYNTDDVSISCDKHIWHFSQLIDICCGKQSYLEFLAQ